MSVFTTYPIYSPFNNRLSLGNLVNLLDDLNQPSAPRGHCQPQRISRRANHFSPRFDIQENDTSYELYGELPGVEKDNVHIDFSDPQTIVIQGRVERTYTSSSPSPTSAENTIAEKQDEETSGAAVAPETDDDAVLVDADTHETSSNKSYQATVEDHSEVDDGQTTTSSTAQQTPATTVTEPAKVETAVTDPAPSTETAPVNNVRYLVHERSKGSFSRSFTFSQRVEHENVTASLHNGILSVNVPKAKKHQSRRIAIF
ncbi:30 kDa heat shock protein [Xylariaceae sp. FL1019]|nr:30 kDa heat shock protein [Xylariaceae sp. FL1019]